MHLFPACQPLEERQQWGGVWCQLFMHHTLSRLCLERRRSRILNQDSESEANLGFQFSLHFSSCLFVERKQQSGGVTEAMEGTQAWFQLSLDFLGCLYLEPMEATQVRFQCNARNVYKKGTECVILKITERRIECNTRSGIRFRGTMSERLYMTHSPFHFLHIPVSSQGISAPSRPCLCLVRSRSCSGFDAS